MMMMMIMTMIIHIIMMIILRQQIIHKDKSTARTSRTPGERRTASTEG